MGYALDATGDYVYFTGATGTNKVIVCALNKNDGSIFFQSLLNIVPGTKDRGYAIKPDNSGNLYVAGVTGSYGYLAKISGINSTNPNLEWVKNAGLSYGARINHLDVDNSGIYISCDIRGVTTYFQVMKVNSDGNLVWAKIFPSYANDRNNTHIVKISGDNLFVGGRIAQDNLDKQNGDGMLMKISKSNDSLLWHGIYFTGIGLEKAAEHRIKEIAIIGEHVYIAGQVYGGIEKHEHFFGTWVKLDNSELQNASVSITSITTAEYEIITGGEVRDGEGTFSASTGILQNATEKTISTTPDWYAFLIKIKI
ncbi:MAG TPA: hypothetical protein ENN45_05340 [Bacteroidetes bacterium]|nr:hypothetical protein [Bacteroidota bacterium]